jgi:hypothetical protein
MRGLSPQNALAARPIGVAGYAARACPAESRREGFASDERPIAQNGPVLAGPLRSVKRA